jgi:histidine triad (HIT) family protein
MATSADCLFCKIVAGKIDADIVHQDDKVLAFRDINPQAPTHVLIIPRNHVPTINDLTESDVDDVGRLFLAARAVAKQEGLEEDGYRAVMNCMEGAGQSVFHLHLHVLGGRPLRWPPG